MKKVPTQSLFETTDVDALRSSIIHDLVPISDQTILIDIVKIEIDDTNPGSKSKSLRYQRRAPSIHDSFDIFSKNIYPIIVCEHPKKNGYYIHVDGFGRLDESKARGFKKISAIVYPPMTLEQRILFRQTLNAAQEPFDATSIITDLWELAKQRNLDISNPEHIKILVRDLPAKVRKHEKDLLILARWHPNAVTLLGESYAVNGETIGIDKFRELDSVVTAIEKNHPKTLTKLGGRPGITLKLASMYVKKKFSDGSRSQDSIRKVARTFKALKQDDASIADFLNKEKSISELPEIEDKPAENNSPLLFDTILGKENLIETCKTLTKILLETDSESLKVNERRVLSRTATVLNQVLDGAS